MHKLVDMKITKAEREEREEKYKGMAVGPGMDGDVYPYGLQIRLDDRALDKLDIKALPKVGRKVRVVCECNVQSTRDAASVHGGKDQRDRSLELQIEKISVSLEATSAVEAIDDELEDA